MSGVEKIVKRDGAGRITSVLELPLSPLEELWERARAALMRPHVRAIPDLPVVTVPPPAGFYAQDVVKYLAARSSEDSELWIGTTWNHIDFRCWGPRPPGRPA
jgi:hypothetical protein